MYRLGSKDKIANQIQHFFPHHSIYVEPFFGVGGMYFNKKLVSLNILNDFDDYVHTFWISLKNNFKELLNEFELIPITEKTFKYYKDLKPENDMEKTLKFIYLNSFSLYGSGTVLASGNIVKKDSVIEGLKKYLKSEHLQRGVFHNKDFREFLKSLSFTNSQKNRILIYSDPPYINTINNYNTPKWGINDLIDLIELKISLQVKFAISEFYSDEIKPLIDKYNLKVISVLSRKNILNYKEEILICNYEPPINFLDLV